MRIAIVGSGVAGLVAAHHLHRNHEITLFEADDRLGGHAHTVDVELDDASFAVDTGFIVCNERTYPRFFALLERLGVPTVESDMSLSVTDARTGAEWGTNARKLFAQPRNIARPSFLALLAQIPMWHRAGTRLLKQVAAGTADPTETLDAFLARHRLRPAFAQGYIVPLTAAVWSADPSTVLGSPAVTICRFLANHGMLALGDRPTWRTVPGGSRRYVEALTRPFTDRIRLSSPVREVRRDGGEVTVRLDGEHLEHFDRVVLAAHAPDSLGLLTDADIDEKEIVGAVRYQPNSAVLHTDRRCLPSTERAWASWNVHLAEDEQSVVTMTYLMNKLQHVPTRHPVCVTLNRDDEIDPTLVLGRFAYSHPVLDNATVVAQGRLAEIQGRGGAHWAGAWTGYGFHEDGVRAGETVADQIEPGCTGLGDTSW